VAFLAFYLATACLLGSPSSPPTPFADLAGRRLGRDCGRRHRLCDAATLRQDHRVDLRIIPMRISAYWWREFCDPAVHQSSVRPRAASRLLVSCWRMAAGAILFR